MNHWSVGFEWLGVITSGLSIPVAALVGLSSMVAGLAVGHLVGGFITPSSSPFLAVGGTAIDLTPIWLKDFAVRTFGSYDNVVGHGGDDRVDRGHCRTVVPALPHAWADAVCGTR
ncbi:MAG TPA: hypothetical protein VF788_00485, partial [Pseudonocardiaceae bacterium]